MFLKIYDEKIVISLFPGERKAYFLLPQKSLLCLLPILGEIGAAKFSA